MRVHKGRFAFLGRHLDRLWEGAKAIAMDIGLSREALTKRLFETLDANRIEDDFAVIVPAGARHNVINTGSVPLRLYTIYGPPEHRDKVVHKARSDAERDHEHWDGETSE